MGSQQLGALVAASFPFQNVTAMFANPLACRDLCANAAGAPGAGFPLGADASPLSVGNWTAISRCWHQSPLLAQSMAPGQAPQPLHQALQGSPRSWSESV